VDQHDVTLGLPRVHYRLVDSTNARARSLAGRGAPHGAMVTAREQSAGRGRQGRTWWASPGQALLCSVIVREPPRLLPLAAGIAVAEEVGPHALVKWPNDVLLEGRKVAGILVEGRPQEGWSVLGIGLNVAVRVAELPPEVAVRAASMGRSPRELEPTLQRLLGRLETWLAAPP
jgi:BirA family transcriptional regulator, biotin operon repressor / biotin---[acetyl-CoA-carboxylase] ligase